MPLRPLRPQVLERVLVLTTCVVALTAAMAWLSPAFSQSAVAPNMRGATWPDSQLDQSDQTGVINYGKPKPKKSKNKPAPAKGAKPLPGLNPYPGAPMIPRRGPRPRGADLMPPAPGVAAVPSLPHPNRPRVEDKPFEPTGLEVGSLRLKPFAEFSAGYDTTVSYTHLDVYKRQKHTRRQTFGLKLIKERLKHLNLDDSNHIARHAFHGLSLIHI